MRKEYLPVKENQNYVQDPDSFALLFNNEFEFKNFESKKNLELRLSNLEKDIDVIKNLLEVLINGKK